MPKKDDLGQRIRRYRRRADPTRKELFARRQRVIEREIEGISQEELSARSGVGQATISEIEAGVCRMPRLGTVIALADGLGVPVANLVAGIRL